MTVWQKDSLKIECLSALEAKKYISDFARLRINVFREYPYFYEGSLEYEKAYLGEYFLCNDFYALAFFDGERICGMGTLIPLESSFAEIKELFAKLKLDAKDYLYFGEVILEAPYRGKKLLPIFMAEAFKVARKLGLSKIAYMSIVSSKSDKLRPANYRDSNAIMQKHGTRLIENSEMTFSYKSALSGQDEAHTMQCYELDVET